MPTNCTRHWIACGPPSRRSNRHSPAVISRTACWCSTMSARAISKASTANLRSVATAVTTGPIARSQSGCPVAVEVFEGNTADPMTLAAQITKLRTRFNLSRVVLVGDRGMITDARLEADVKPAGLDWITALRARSIRDLAAENGPLQLSLFD